MRCRTHASRGAHGAARKPLILTTRSPYLLARTPSTERARGYFTGQPPSSPSIAILRDGKLVYMMPRRDIESREAPAIAADLKAALDKYCARPVAVCRRAVHFKRR